MCFVVNPDLFCIDYYVRKLFLSRLFNSIFSLISLYGIVVDLDVVSCKSFVYKRGEIAVKEGIQEGFAVRIVDIGSF